jgi:hypothetical protein
MRTAPVEGQVGAPSALEKDFVSSAACLADMEGRYGATPPSLFCRGRGGRKPDGHILGEGGIGRIEVERGHVAHGSRAYGRVLSPRAPWQRRRHAGDRPH